jgi:WD40 repeat protein/energy-coupling factor transporter ATP-binding protein EcfA2
MCAKMFDVEVRRSGMTLLFISHSSRDRALADRFVSRLRASGFGSLFCDSDPSQGIAPGRAWERELYAALRRADAILFLATPDSVGSRWCFAELALGRSLGIPVFAVRTTAEVRLSLIDDVQWMNLDGDDMFSRLLQGLEGAGLDPDDSFAWDPRRSPYPGLEAFTSEDAAVFFGRGRETARLIELIQPTLVHESGRWVGIVGPSGSGKSSLLRAGLLPRLIKMSDRWTILPTLIPGTNPTRQLAGCLAHVLAQRGLPHDRSRIENQLAAREGSHSPSDELVDRVRELCENTNGSRKNVLLTIDQAEELLTRTPEIERRRFLELLRGSLTPESPLWIVSTMRSEFLSTAPDRSGLSDSLDDTLLVEPLNRGRLSEVILRPARQAGVSFEAGLAERMVDETTGGDALPLLAYTLHELVRDTKGEQSVSIADYERIGGVVGALQRRADHILDELTRRGKGPDVLPTLLKLAAVDAADEAVRRRVALDSLAVTERAVIDAFMEARLLVTRVLSDAAETVSVEVAHEALLRQWPPLRKAIEDSGNSLRMRAELEHLAADWEERGRDESYLLRGGRLASFAEWAALRTSELTAIESAFLKAGQDLASRELDRQRRSNRRLRRLLLGAVLLLVIAVLSAVFAFRQSEAARRQTSLAVSRQLLTTSRSVGSTQPDVSLLLNVEAWKRSPPGVRRDAEVSLLENLNQQFHIATQIETRGGGSNAVAFSPDGALVASANNDHTIRVFRIADGTEVGAALTGHTDLVHGVAFSALGSVIASASKDGTVRLWDANTHRQIGRPLTGHQAPVSSVDFSPDGRLVVSAGEDGKVRLWDVKSGRQHGPPMSGHLGPVWDARFSPDGRLVASAGADGTLRLWNVATGRADGAPLRGHTGWVNGVAFSHDGSMLASAGADGTIRLRSVASRREVGRFVNEGAGEASSVAFSPDDKLLVSGCRDGSLRLWSTDTRQQVGPPLSGHANAVRGVAFDRSGSRIASASFDGTVRVWETRSTQLEGAAALSVSDRAVSVAFNSSGSTLAAGGADGAIRLWDAAHDVVLGSLTGHTGWVESVAFSPDGSLLASAGADGTVRLWSEGTRKSVGRPMIGHRGEVSSVVFADDGDTLISAGRDGTIRFWDPSSGRQTRGPTRAVPGGQVLSLALNASGSVLASGDNTGKVRLWNVTTGKPATKPLAGHTGWVLDVAFSPDGKTVASASGDGTIRLWDAKAGRQRLAPLAGHTDEVDSVAFSPDSRLLASASKDGTVRFWSTDDGRLLGVPVSGPGGEVSDVAFGRSGELATANADGSVRMLDLSAKTLTDEACRIANRNLTRAEWSKFVGPALPWSRTCQRFG